MFSMTSIRGMTPREPALQVAGSDRRGEGPAGKMNLGMSLENDWRRPDSSTEVMRDRPPRRRRMETCDRCGGSFMDGYRWSGLGMPLVLRCQCTQDIEESV